MTPRQEQHAAKMRARYAELRGEMNRRNRFGKARKLLYGLSGAPRAMHERRLWRERARKGALKRRCREHPIAVMEGVFAVGSSWPDLEAYLWRTLGPPPFSYRKWQKKGLI